MANQELAGEMQPYDGEVDDAYQARGTVYYDEKTGNYYFVAD